MTDAFTRLREWLTTCPVCSGHTFSEWHSDPADWCGFCQNTGQVTARRRYAWRWFWKHNHPTPGEWCGYILDMLRRKVSQDD